MINHSHFLFSSLLFFTGVSLVCAQGGGPLLPPGPPADGVYRTAEEIEPRIPISAAGFVITESGSYYLTKNLSRQPCQKEIVDSNGEDEGGSPGGARIVGLIGRGRE